MVSEDRLDPREAPLHYRYQLGRYRLHGQSEVAGFKNILKWQFNGGRARWPRWIENQAFSPPPQRAEGHNLLATWLGHSTVLLQIAGLNILTDPLLSKRASPWQWVGPKRVRAPGLSIDQLPPIDIVLVSHNHYDHMDLPALAEISRRHKPRLITPLGNARYISCHGSIEELDWHASVSAGATTISLAPALHWSKRYLFAGNTALWGAFVIATPAGRIYFAGDTGYGQGATFRHIRETFGPPRLSLLPIGAYEPRWFMQPHHMNPQEAVRAHLDLASARSLAIHHGTIQLTDEPIDAPMTALAQALGSSGVDPSHFLVPDVGETISIP